MNRKYNLVLKSLSKEAQKIAELISNGYCNNDIIKTMQITKGFYYRTLATIKFNLEINNLKLRKVQIV